MSENNEGKDNKVKGSTASMEKPYVELPYTPAMSGLYCGNDLKDLLKGHMKNSYGVEGMDITGRSDYKKIVKVPDKIKALVVNEAKRAFYECNGMCGDDMKKLDSYKQIYCIPIFFICN